MTARNLDPMANATLRERFTQDDNDNFSDIFYSGAGFVCVDVVSVIFFNLTSGFLNTHNLAESPPC